jgi:anti-sigma regulatory factor (Ser/Thr protein kinase)
MADDLRRHPQPPEHRSSPPILDQAFDRDSLYVLRAAVAAHATHAGLPPARVGDLILVVHELAANAVRHGAGHGRLRIWKHDQALQCEVTDDGAPQPAGPGTPPDPGIPPDLGTPSDPAPWSSEPGHGLWVVRRLADQASFHSGAHGTSATVSLTFGPPRPEEMSR